GLDAVEPRHVDVEEDDRGRGLGGPLDRLDPVAGRLQLEARDVLERRRDEAADEGIVVDDEDGVAHGRRAGARPISRRTCPSRAAVIDSSASTTRGSSCVPEPLAIAARAAAKLRAAR